MSALAGALGRVRVILPVAADCRQGGTRSCCSGSGGDIRGSGGGGGRAAEHDVAQRNG